jgi:hypothetical protein
MTLGRAQPSLLLSLLLLSLPAPSQTPAETLPTGTPLPVQTTDHLPMHAGQPIRAELIYPVFVDNTLTLPAKTTLTGTVTELRSDHSRRVSARVNGDFTPYHIPIVHFTHIILADGTELPIATGTATDGAPLLRLTAPKPHKGGLIHKEWDYGMQVLHDQTAVFTAPGKADRFVQFIYHQLPYHPQRIEKGTAWTIETTEPLSIPAQPASTIAAATPTPADPAPAPDSNGRQPWIIQAFLRDQLTSATAKSGQPITAIVAEPVYNADHTIAVPQGATIIGAITNAKPAKSFARAGALGFDFKQIALPDGQTQNVQTALTGADAAANANLAMDSEGKVNPKPQDKIVVPLLLAILATRPLDDDLDGQAARNTVGANGFGFAGNIIGLAGGSAKISTGIGAYGTAVSIYRRWIARGREVTFAHDTRLVLQTTPRTATVLKPN